MLPAAAPASQLSTSSPTLLPSSAPSRHHEDTQQMLVPSQRPPETPPLPLVEAESAPARIEPQQASCQRYAPNDGRLHETAVKGTVYITNMKMEFEVANGRLYVDKIFGPGHLLQQVVDGRHPVTVAGSSTEIAQRHMPLICPDVDGGCLVAAGTAYRLLTLCIDGETRRGRATKKQRLEAEPQQQPQDPAAAVAVDMAGVRQESSQEDVSGDEA